MNRYQHRVVKVGLNLRVYRTSGPRGLFELEVANRQWLLEAASEFAAVKPACECYECMSGYENSLAIVEGRSEEANGAL